MLSPGLLINIDRLFDWPYRVARWFVGRRNKEVKRPSKGQVMILKMMGIGSITRIYNDLLSVSADPQQFVLVTLSSNQELCDVLHVPNVHYIKSNSLFNLVVGLIHLSFLIRKQKPAHLINYERSSNLLGLYQLLTTCYTNICTSSIHDVQQDLHLGKDHILSIQGKSFEELVAMTHVYFPKQSEKQEPYTFQVQVNPFQVVINVNASDYMPHRKYPLEKFAVILEQLHLWNPKLVFDLVGSENESNYVNTLAKVLKAKGIECNNQCGQWDIKILMRNLSKCALFITNDSGPMHFGAHLRIPMIVIWGPTSPKVFGYDENDNAIANIYTSERCSPCFIYAKSKAAKTCHGAIDCMNKLDSSLIIDEAKKKLAQTTTTRNSYLIGEEDSFTRTAYSMAI